MRPLLIVAAGRSLTPAPLGRREDDVEVRRVLVLPPASALDPWRPTVIALDRSLLASSSRDHATLSELAKVAAFVGIGDSGDTEPPEDFPVELLSSFTPGGASPATAIANLRGAFRHAATLVAAHGAREQEELLHRELGELTRLGVALSTERDLLTLLEMILGQARRITNSDAGSLYLIERRDDGAPADSLRFMISQNHSLPNLAFGESTVPMDSSSLAGYAATTGEPLMIGDVYLLPDDVSYRQNRSFDERFGYRTKSMLVLPMKTHRDEVIGVLQLINRKRTAEARLVTAEVVEREVIAYDQHSVELVSALASQAAVSIENSKLYEDIERLFEGFVTAAVTAIESRDPSTFGHSGRVARLTVGLAEAVDRVNVGPYRELRFSREQLRELRYAGLLHDFGKVGVREQVLVKQKKLYPWDLDVIRGRFGYLRQAIELQFERERAEYLLAHGADGYDQFVSCLERLRCDRRREVDRFLDAIMQANEPTILPEDSFEALRGMQALTYTDFDGVPQPLLREEELQYLMIPKGNLDDDERREIESHVTHTYRFLGQIPWTRELRNIPDIAYAHHEKLDGTGYPRRVRAGAIPVQARMMAIADIFDALTATDRPYKRAVSPTGALDILGMEAKSGALDAALLDTFIEARIYLSVGAERGD